MSCVYYEFKSALFGGDYWCNKKDCRVDDNTYRRYCRDYSYDECPIYKKTESSGACFITTVVCKIVGLKDNDQVLQNLRNFRDNILQPNEKYYDILKEYDAVGPLLADCIINDKDKEEIATGLYKNCIQKINKEIIKKEYDKAIEHYYLMTLLLVNYYGLKHEYNNIKSNNYGNLEFNPETAGHGLRKIKIKESV